MCFGACKHEIGSGPKRGQCGGGRVRCPVDYCTICGDLTEDDKSICGRCEEDMNDFNEMWYKEAFYE